MQEKGLMNHEIFCIRFNYEMLEWFKSQGKGWQTHMDKVLCAYYEAHKKQTPTP